MIPRFFCPFPLHPGATVELAVEAAHHALKVLRIGAGDTAILFDGRGGQWRATLHPAGKALRAVLDEFDDAVAQSVRIVSCDADLFCRNGNRKTVRRATNARARFVKDNRLGFACQGLLRTVQHG